MSGTGRGLVELSAGSRVVLAGTQWQVRELEPHTGRVLVSDLDPLAPTRFEADGVVELPAVTSPDYVDAVVGACAVSATSLSIVRPGNRPCTTSGFLIPGSTTTGRCVV